MDGEREVPRVDAVEIRVDEDVAIITINNPPVNVLSRAVRAGLIDALERAAQDDAVRAVVLMAEGGPFPSGSDPKEYGKMLSPGLAELCQTVEDCPVPVVAALHGTVLEAGLSLAAACHYRVAGARARIGAPEVTVGLVPGGGVTQRLPRLIGPMAAVELLTSGQPIDGQKAFELGLVDKVVQARVAPAAHEFARELVGAGMPPRRTCDIDAPLRGNPELLPQLASKRAAFNQSRLEAPGRVVECIEASIMMPFMIGVAREQAAIGDCLASDQTAALRHAYFAERRAARPMGYGPNDGRVVQKVGIAGTHALALSISMAALDHGVAVELVGAEADQLVIAEQRMTASYTRAVQQGQMSQDEAEKRLELFHAATDLTMLEDCELVIEATSGVPERRAAILARIEAQLPDTTTLATTADVGFDILRDALTYPDRFVGLHFFAPAQVIRAVELVRPDTTTAHHVATAHGFVRRIGKVPVSCAPSNGLIANRLQMTLFAAVDVLLIMGARPAQIDGAMRAYGFSVGACQMMDALGLAHIAGAVTRELVAHGRKGSEGGGFFDRGNTGEDSAQALSILDQMRARVGISARAFHSREIIDRLVAALANDGARLISSGAVPRPVEIDVAMMLAKGYPRWRGGPMKQADLSGILQMRNRLRSYADEAPDLWQPDDLWDKLLRNARNFEALNDAQGMAQ